MKKTKWLAACIAACALALVAGCSSGDDDKPYLPGVVETDDIKYDPAKWVIEGTKVVRYTGAEADVRIPDGVTIIGESAFEGCTSLESVTIPASVKSIGFCVFENCTSLNDVKYGGTLAQWCQMDNDLMLVGNATSIKLSDGTDLKSLTTLEIPSGVTKIGDSAFASCTSLASVTIPGSVTSIGNSAFAFCTSLASVEIPASVESIGRQAFNNCTSLAVTYGGTLSQWCQMDNDLWLVRNATSIKLSDGTDLKSLTTLEIPSGVTSIGKGAFSYCESLASVEIPGSVESIGSSAFSSCTSLASVTIPASVTSIGEEAFSYCESLASVTIPASVTSIERYAFSSCTSLASVTIPASVTSIGNGAFYNCTSLKEVKYGGTAEQWKQIDIDPTAFPYNAKITDKEGKEITE